MQKLFSLDGKVVRILTFLTDLIILNTLFIVSCIPIVTIGASLTSLTTMWYRILKGKDTDIAYHYFGSLDKILNSQLLFGCLSS